MSEEIDERLAKLLRLKKYEQPPPEYFENFLKEFHVRQRQELLRRPAWRLALERLETRMDGWMARFSVPQLSYAGASAAVLLAAGVFTVNLLQHPGQSGLGGAEVARADSTPAAQPTQLAAAPVAPRTLTLNPQAHVAELIPQEVFQPAATRQLHPRYILDSRPVSYEPPFSF